jgi:hypothetical protein
VPSAHCCTLPAALSRFRGIIAEPAGGAEPSPVNPAAADGATPSPVNAWQPQCQGVRRRVPMPPNTCSDHAQCRRNAPHAAAHDTTQAGSCNCNWRRTAGPPRRPLITCAAHGCHAAAQPTAEPAHSCRPHAGCSQAAHAAAHAAQATAHGIGGHAANGGPACSAARVQQWQT